MLINRYDISDDGQIDQKELTKLISAMVKSLHSVLAIRDAVICFSVQYDLLGETDRKGDRDPKKRAADIIGRLDVGGDRKLSKQEFIAG
jgi:Ca2+-binding EF-hand superfamily protein